jgi:hypothetical protein
MEVSEARLLEVTTNPLGRRPSPLSESHNGTRIKDSLTPRRLARPWPFRMRNDCDCGSDGMAAEELN